MGFTHKSGGIFLFYKTAPRKRAFELNGYVNKAVAPLIETWLLHPGTPYVSITGGHGPFAKENSLDVAQSVLS